jgi:hypothetical protein
VSCVGGRRLGLPGPGRSRAVAVSHVRGPQDGSWSVNWRTVIVEAVSIGLSAVHRGIVGRLLPAVGIRIGRGDRKCGGDSELIGRGDVEKLGGVLERAVIERQVAQVQSVPRPSAMIATGRWRCGALGRK